MRIAKSALLFCLFAGVAAQEARAATITVGPGGGYDHATIQEALDAAGNGDTVIVEAGTYTGSLNRNLDFGGKSITLQSDDGAAFCTIDVQDAGGNRAFLFNDGETTASKVIGFTIKRGNMTGTSDGGAIRCTNADPTIQDCVFDDNHAAGRAGAIYLDNTASPVITGCIFTGNDAGGAGSGAGAGGAIAMTGGCVPSITNCDFISNSSDAKGGAIWLGGDSDPVIDSCVFRDNVAGDRGGAIHAEGASSEPIVTHCFIFRNEGLGGGGVNVEDANLLLRNCHLELNECTGSGGGVRISNAGTAIVQGCTIYDNQAGTDASGDGGGFYVTGASSQLTITNSILWTNDDDSGADQITEDSGPTLDVDDCCVQDGDYDADGTGNITSNPDLLTHSSADQLNGLHFHIDTDSPCIDVGDDVWGTWDFDIDGEDRTQDTEPDMGVDEI